jgi:hypothetical protein
MQVVSYSRAAFLLVVAITSPALAAAPSCPADYNEDGA